MFSVLFFFVGCVAMMDEAETQLKDQITDLDLKQVEWFYHYPI